MATASNAAQKAEIVGVVQRQVAARCPPESVIDVIFSCFNGRVDMPTGHKVAGMLAVATEDPRLVAAALLAVVRTGRLSWLGIDADEAVVACLPMYAPEIGALLQRPGLIPELHAAAPFAAVGLVMSVLQAVCALPITPAAEVQRSETFNQLRCAAGHCLEMVTDGLRALQWNPHPPTQFSAIALAARLAGHNAASLPVDSADRLAAVLAHCCNTIDKVHTVPGGVHDEADSASSPQTLAYCALVPALATLGSLGSLHQEQPLTPRVATTVLGAEATLLERVAGTGKPLNIHWASLYAEPLVEAAVHLAQQKNLDAFMVQFCCALLQHGDALPDPRSKPDEQVMTNSANVSLLFSHYAEQVARGLDRRAESSKSGGKPCNTGGSSSQCSILHTPPLQTHWHTALAAALQALVPWLDQLGVVEAAGMLLDAATRLAGAAAASLQAAAEGADAAAVLERPAALALVHALEAFLDIRAEHMQYAVLGARERPGTADRFMGSLRAVAKAMRALAMAVAKATAAAEAAGRPPPSAVLLQVACMAASSSQLELAQAEHEYACLQPQFAGFGSRPHDLAVIEQAMALTVDLHSSGAPIRSMMDMRSQAAGTTSMIYRMTVPDLNHYSAFGIGSLPALQAACKALAQLVAGSAAAKRQCMAASILGPAWPQVAAVVRQELRRLPARVRTLGEKALQQVEQALQGGQQRPEADRAEVAAPAPPRSQADADLAMQMLLEEEQAASKPSKAAQKRAKKKAAARQAADDAAAPATAAVHTSQQQPPQGLPADTQTCPTEPSSSAAVADMQQLRLDAPAAAAASSPTDASAEQQSDDDWMLCPVSKVVMEDPVMCSDGYTYSRAAITRWLADNGALSPTTGQPLARLDLIPNHALRNTIEALLQRQARSG